MNRLYDKPLWGVFVKQESLDVTGFEIQQDMGIMH